VVFCSDMVPCAPHRFRYSHLPESSIVGRDRRAPRSTWLREIFKSGAKAEKTGAATPTHPILGALYHRYCRFRKHRSVDKHRPAEWRRLTTC
jgi:hypothetical protein